MLNIGSVSVVAIIISALNPLFAGAKVASPSSLNFTFVFFCTTLCAKTIASKPGRA